MPVMWAHWYLLYGFCSLTLLENYLSGRDPFHGNGFVNKLLKPMFLFPNNKPYIINISIWIISILLWLKVIYDFVKDDYKELKFLKKIIDSYF